MCGEESIIIWSRCGSQIRACDVSVVVQSIDGVIKEIKDLKYRTQSERVEIVRNRNLTI